MEDGGSNEQSSMLPTTSHPLSQENVTKPASANQVSKSQTSDESGVLARIRILSLHLLMYLYKNDHDYVHMMSVLRELLDWLQKHEDFMKLKLKLPNDLQDLPLDMVAVEKPETPTPSPECGDVVESIMSDFLDSELPDSEIVNKIEEAEGFEMVDVRCFDSRCFETSDSITNPLFVWQFMFDVADYNISDFISPLQTGNFGVIVKLMILYAVSAKKYDARIRTYILCISQILKIDYQMFQAYELAVVDEVHSGEQYKKKKEKLSAKGIAAVGLAATGGAVLMTLTGGLAAPFVVSGLATIVGTSSTAFLATTAGLATIAAMFGAVGGGLAGYKVSKLVGNVEEFEFVRVKEEPSVALTIMVDGLAKREKVGVNSWKVLNYSQEQYLLKYETKHLLRFSTAVSDLLKDTAVALAADEIVRYTIFSALAASLAWPVTLLSLADVIDNPWSMCMKRSKAVGIHLSSVLLKKIHGDRPVTLVGYGLGARVIFFCLLDMVTKHKPEEYSGIIENAVLCGAPVTSQSLVWRKLCDAVSGKLINGYSSNDWVLSFLYKTTRVTTAVAGIRAVDVSDRKLLNVDLSSVISGHFDYFDKMGEVLKIFGMGS